MKLKLPPEICAAIGIPTNHTIRIAPVKKGGNRYVKAFWWDEKEKKHKSKHIGVAKRGLESEQQIQRAVEKKIGRLQEEARATTLAERDGMAPTREVLGMFKRRDYIRGFADAGDHVAKKYEEMIKNGDCHSAWAWRRIREIHQDLREQMQELGWAPVDVRESINVLAKMSKLGFDPRNSMDIRRYLTNARTI